MGQQLILDIGEISAALVCNHGFISVSPINTQVAIQSLNSIGLKILATNM